MNFIDSDMVSDYIDNEIDYIKCDIETHKKYNDTRLVKTLQQDLDYLERLSDSDIEEITQKINNDEELQDKISELIHFWVYHY